MNRLTLCVYVCVCVCVCGSSWGFLSGRRSDTPPYARWPSSRGSQPSSHPHFLGHLSRMSEERLSKQLLVSAPVGGKRTAGGQKRRWNDLVVNDLKQCNLSRSWREQAQERDSWRATIKCRVELLNKPAEDKEKSCKDEKKR